MLRVPERQLWRPAAAGKGEVQRNRGVHPPSAPPFLSLAIRPPPPQFACNSPASSIHRCSGTVHTSSFPTAPLGRSPTRCGTRRSRVPAKRPILADGAASTRCTTASAGAGGAPLHQALAVPDRVVRGGPRRRAEDGGAEAQAQGRRGRASAGAVRRVRVLALEPRRRVAVRPLVQQRAAAAAGGDARGRVPLGRRDRLVHLLRLAAVRESPRRLPALLLGGAEAVRRRPPHRDGDRRPPPLDGPRPHPRAGRRPRARARRRGGFRRARVLPRAPHRLRARRARARLLRAFESSTPTATASSPPSTSEAMVAAELPDRDRLAPPARAAAASSTTARSPPRSTPPAPATTRRRCRASIPRPRRRRAPPSTTRLAVARATPPPPVGPRRTRRRHAKAAGGIGATTSFSLNTAPSRPSAASRSRRAPTSTRRRRRRAPSRSPRGWKARRRRPFPLISVLLAGAAPAAAAPRADARPADPSAGPAITPRTTPTASAALLQRRARKVARARRGEAAGNPGSTRTSPPPRRRRAVARSSSIRVGRRARPPLAGGRQAPDASAESERGERAAAGAGRRWGSYQPTKTRGELAVECSSYLLLLATIGGNRPPPPAWVRRRPSARRGRPAWVAGSAMPPPCMGPPFRRPFRRRPFRRPCRCRPASCGRRPACRRPCRPCRRRPASRRPCRCRCP